MAVELVDADEFEDCFDFLFLSAPRLRAGIGPSSSPSSSSSLLRSDPDPEPEPEPEPEPQSSSPSDVSDPSLSASGPQSSSSSTCFTFAFFTTFPLDAATGRFLPPLPAGVVTSGFGFFDSGAAFGLAEGACKTDCVGRDLGTLASSSSESLLAVPRMPLKAPITRGGLNVVGFGAADFAAAFALALSFSAGLVEAPGDDFGFGLGVGVGAGSSGMRASSLPKLRDFGASGVPVRSATLLSNMPAWF